MTKTSHVGKTSRDKQSYFDVFTRSVGDSTVKDDVLEPSPAESDVPEQHDKKVIKQLSRRKTRRNKGLNWHLQNNFATYIVGLLSVIALIMITIGFPLYGNIEKMSSQIQAQNPHGRCPQRWNVNILPRSPR